MNHHERINHESVHSKKKQSVQVVHVRRNVQSAQETVTLHASPSSVQESAQEIPVVHNLETLGNCPLFCCGIFLVEVHSWDVLQAYLN